MFSVILEVIVRINVIILSLNEMGNFFFKRLLIVWDGCLMEGLKLKVIMDFK